MAKTHRFNFHKLLKPIRLVLVGMLALVFVVFPSIHSPATTPEAAYINHIQGSDLFIGAGTSNSRQPAQLNNQLQGNSILYVPGGRRGWANLGFVVDSPLDTVGLLVKAGPDDVASQWSFPCAASGGFTIGWQQGSNRGCEEGVRLTATGARSQGRADPNGEDFFESKGVLRTGTEVQSREFTLEDKEVFTAQAGGEEVIVSPPNSNAVTIQTRSSNTGIEVDTILGDILVRSAQYPQGRLIPEGQKYSYPQDTMTPIDRNAIANSPEMQDFVNPNNWSLPNLPERVADGLTQQLGEMRTALESVPPSQPTATQPTPSQPTATQPTPSQPTATQPTVAQPTPSHSEAQISWELDVDVFKLGDSCSTVDPEEYYRDSDYQKAGILQTGSSLFFEGWIYTSRYNHASTSRGTVAGPAYYTLLPSSSRLTGNITDTKVQMLQEFELHDFDDRSFEDYVYGYVSIIYNGILNPNGQIVGTATVKGDICDGLSTPFTMTQLDI